MSGVTGGTAPSPSLELLDVATAMSDPPAAGAPFRLGSGAVAPATRPTVLLQQPSRPSARGGCGRHLGQLTFEGLGALEEQLAELPAHRIREDLFFAGLDPIEYRLGHGTRRNLVVTTRARAHGFEELAQRRYQTALRLTTYE